MKKLFKSYRFWWIVVYLTVIFFFKWCTNKKYSEKKDAIINSNTIVKERI